MKWSFTFLSLLIIGYTNAQFQNVWCFGSQWGLDFNSGNPVAIQTGIAAHEGNASVCDQNGRLLFYTEGANVWNRDHNIMPNGSSLTGLLSTYSTTQSSVIVPMAGNSAKYYLFSLSSYTTQSRSQLFYSIVDMELNGGLGDVVAGNKGIFLDSGLAEKMTAVAGKGQNVWVMVRSLAANEYKAFAVTKNGINTNPVISACGEFELLDYCGGEIKFSSNRRKMAAACTGTGMYSFRSGITGLELYDFNAATGIVSNAVKVDVFNFSSQGSYYGVNFSPDNSKLYASVTEGVTLGNNQYNNGVYQFDLNVPINEIAGTKTRLTDSQLTSIKIGPDGKMYIAGGFPPADISIINFPNLAGTAFQFVQDAITFASFPFSLYGLPNEIVVWGGNDDTVYYCNNGNGIQLIDSIEGPDMWQVISGPGIINGSGDTVTVTTTANTRILFNGGAGRIPDTVTILLLDPKLNAGPDVTVFGCNGFLDTLHATLVDTLPGLKYDIAWQPGISIVTGGNTLHPVITPASNTIYKITVTTPMAQGGCLWEDSVHITTIDSTVHAGFTYTIGQGCSGDTVTFANNSTGSGTPRYEWDFGDGTDAAENNATHIYKTGGQYIVKLYAFNERCIDSVSEVVTIAPFLDASFTVHKDTICQGDTVACTNTSTGTGIISSWDLGDGLNETTTDPLYNYNTPGLHQIILSVSDHRGCHDTASRFIQVDAISNNSFEVSDSVCAGQAITLIPKTDSTIIELRWGFDDGISTIAGMEPIQYSYDRAGDFVVHLNAKFRACPELSYQAMIHVYPFPAVDLGPDTSLCPNDPPIVLSSRQMDQPGVQYHWNTGAIAHSISISHPAMYVLTATSQYGCAASDTIEVYKGCYIAIPNVFTPNRDGMNDYFFPREALSKKLSGFRMQIYNRWGQLLFETNKTNGSGWDGTFNGVDQTEGAYIYVVEAIIGNKTEKYQGNVTLLR